MYTSSITIANITKLVATLACSRLSMLASTYISCYIDQDLIESMYTSGITVAHVTKL